MFQVHRTLSLVSCAVMVSHSSCYTADVHVQVHGHVHIEHGKLYWRNYWTNKSVPTTSYFVVFHSDISLVTFCIHRKCHLRPHREIMCSTATSLLMFQHYFISKESNIKLYMNLVLNNIELCCFVFSFTGSWHDSCVK